MKEQDRRIPSGELNRFIRHVVEEYPPPSAKGRQILIRYATHVSRKPPTFVLFVNDPDGVSTSYERYLVNQLRSTYGFEGNPIRIRFRGGQGGRGQRARDPGE
jgi:GTP-binding protein